MSRALRTSIVPLTATVIARGTTLALGHNGNAVLECRRTFLGCTASRAAYAEADVARLVRIRAHLLALRIELTAHSAAAIALQSLRHALEVLVRGLPVAHLLGRFTRRLAAAVVAHRAAGGVHKDGFATLHWQHAFGLDALLSATWGRDSKS